MREPSLLAILAIAESRVVRVLPCDGKDKRETRRTDDGQGLFRALVRNASGVIAVLDAGGNPRYVGDTVSKFLGYSPAQVCCRADSGMAALIHPDDRQAFAGALTDVLEGPGRLVRVDLRLRHANSAWIWMEASVQNLLEDSEVAGLVLNLRDVNGRRRNEERFRSLVHSAQDIICLADARSRIRYLSPAFRRVLGYDPETCIGASCFEHVHPGDIDRARGAFERLFEVSSGEATVELRVRHRDGSWRHLEVVGRDLHTEPSVEGVVLSARDVTGHKAFEEQLAHRALHDALTNLPNRALFDNRLEHAIERTGRRETRVAVLFLDLDGFKSVNDSLGHEVGDELLVAVGRRLQATLRPADTVARLGGDEFAVLLEDLPSPGDASDAGRRVVDALKKPFDLLGRRVFTSASVGVAISDHGAPNRPAELLRKADLAMYRAKESGRGRCSCFDSSLDVRVQERLDREDDLRRAALRGEFEVYYQPVVRVADRRITGMEALLRWRHPDKGILEPREFIQTAEEMDLILSIGDQVIREACRKLGEWRRNHPRQPPLAMSVNLSRKQLADPDLVREIDGLLRETGLDPGMLRLEITENVFMEDPSSNLHVFRSLKRLGVQLVMDNFGTGYSSFAYLKSLPIAAIKIDRSFVRFLEEDSEQALLVSAMSTLARTLGKEVLAGGVETAGQLSHLREAGCDAVQGDYFWTPLSGATADEVVASWTQN